MARPETVERHPRIGDRSGIVVVSEIEQDRREPFYAGHFLFEHHNGLIVDADLTKATGYAEGDYAKEMLGRLPKRQRRRTVAGDKNYDTKAFVSDVRAAGLFGATFVGHERGLW